MSGIVGILLAGGIGQRFDASGKRHKLLQPLPDGQPIIRHSAQTLTGVCKQVIAIIRPGPHAAALADCCRLAGCDIELTEASENGMGHSIAAGVAASSGADGWIILPADMPWVHQASVGLILKALKNGAEIAAPMYQQQRGHPVGFASRCRDELLALRGDSGARSLFGQFALEQIDVSDSGVLRDVDVESQLADSGLDCFDSNS